MQIMQDNKTETVAGIHVECMLYDKSDSIQHMILHSYHIMLFVTYITMCIIMCRVYAVYNKSKHR